MSSFGLRGITLSVGNRKKHKYYTIKKYQHIFFFGLQKITSFVGNRKKIQPTIKSYQSVFFAACAELSYPCEI